VSDLAKGGPVHSQAEGVVKLLLDQTAIHLVTLGGAAHPGDHRGHRGARVPGLPIGSVIVNRNIPPFLPPEVSEAAAG
jgi:hypothetical protein